MMQPLFLALVLLSAARALPAQSVLDRSPNLQGVWTLDHGNAAFVFAHRFEFLSGGDELINFPTLTLALGLPLGLTAGLDYTSYSEVIPGRVTGNETQYWLKRALLLGDRTTFAGLVAYNTAAESVDAALGVRGEFGPVALLGELRGFSSQFGTGEAGGAGAIGANLRLTPYLGITGDVGRVFSPDSVPLAWSAGVAVAIPGSPHTFSLQASNGGAITLQGASREKTVGFEEVRYGFVFTVPLGTGSQWARIFQPAPATESTSPLAPGDSIAARVEMRQITFDPREVRIRAGQSVEWINYDPLVHTVTANDESWGSEFLQEGDRFVQRFDEPGRYPYHCVPHPQMTGVVIVEE